jgi:hypothetical protein
MISAYTMTVYVQPDMRACASAILELLLCWPPMPNHVRALFTSVGNEADRVGPM